MVRSHRRYLLSAAGASLVGLCIVITSVWGPRWRATNREKNPGAIGANHSRLGAAPRTARPAAASRGGAASPSAAPALARTTTAAELGDRGEPETALSRARATALATNPDIAEYERLRAKALPTAEEQAQLRTMLGDPALVAAARQNLAADESELSEPVQYARMARVDFLDAALEWTENPEREAVLRAMEDVILAPNVRAAQPMDLQRSLAGDKTELYMSLLERDPARAKDVAARAKGTSLEKIIAYAQVRFDATKAYSNGGG